MDARVRRLSQTSDRPLHPLQMGRRLAAHNRWIWTARVARSPYAWRTRSDVPQQQYCAPCGDGAPAMQEGKRGCLTAYFFSRADLGRARLAAHRAISRV
jgi:hypothetical protein